MESSGHDENFKGASIPHDPASIQALDRAAIGERGVPGLLLMERASGNLTRLLIDRFRANLKHGVRILVGRGNNGGDGLAMARQLSQRGVAVEVFLTADKGHPDVSDADQNLWLAAAALGPEGIQDREALLVALTRPDRYGGVWVDALLGTGFHGRLREPAAKIINHLNGRGEAVFAVDIPSGLDGTQGEPCPEAVRATITGTLGTTKTGFLRPRARPFLGECVSLGIGWPLGVVVALAPPT